MITILLATAYTLTALLLTYILIVKARKEQRWYVLGYSLFVAYPTIFIANEYFHTTMSATRAIRPWVERVDSMLAISTSSDHFPWLLLIGLAAAVVTGLVTYLMRRSEVKRNQNPQ
jgi:uncharacterized metal-binding protein